MRYKNKHINFRQHIEMPEVEVKKVSEPRPLCSICSEPIESIIEAISESEGSFSHFDCVIKKLSEKYNVGENEKISYCGQGNFAIFVKNEEGNYFIKEKIPYENANSFDNMKKFVEGTKK